MKALSLCCTMLACLGAVSAPALAQTLRAQRDRAMSTTVVQGQESPAQACAADARRMADGEMGMIEAIAPCTIAIETEPLTHRDLASTYVNRGVIQLIAGDDNDAEGDLNKAAELEPTLGEAYVNRGSLMIRRNRYAEAVAEIDRGLGLGAKEPERAYYNRGLALEMLGNVRGAYESFRKAAELKPGWPPAKDALARFSVASSAAPPR